VGWGWRVRRYVRILVVKIVTRETFVHGVNLLAGDVVPALVGRASKGWHALSRAHKHMYVKRDHLGKDLWNFTKYMV